MTTGIAVIDKNEYENLVRDSEKLCIIETIARNESVPFYRETVLTICGYAKKVEEQ